MFLFRSVAMLILAACLSSGVAAQSAVHYREGEQVNPHDVARILGATPIHKTRSIRLLDGGAAPAPQPSSLSLPIRFAFDSAEVVNAARSQLDAVAEGIKLLPAGQSIYIDGHTDSVGTEEYNQKLSQRRARAVKQYLVNVHGIDANRLKDSGLGESKPIDGRDGGAPENRRVEFRGR